MFATLVNDERSATIVIDTNNNNFLTSRVILLEIFYKLIENLIIIISLNDVSD